MAIVSIVRQENGTVAFDPPQTTIKKGSVVVFRNDDPREPHLITRDGSDPNFWFPYPLAAFVAGRPADTSDEVLFNTVGTVTFVCATHAGETGTIEVTA